MTGTEIFAAIGAIATGSVAGVIIAYALIFLVPLLVRGIKAVFGVPVRLGRAVLAFHRLLRRLRLRPRTYKNYWRGRQGSTVRIKRGALEGRRGRLNMVCYNFGGVYFPEEGEVFVIYTDLEIEE
jgi:hypothetical protein